MPHHPFQRSRITSSYRVPQEEVSTNSHQSDRRIGLSVTTEFSRANWRDLDTAIEQSSGLRGAIHVLFQSKCQH